MALARGRIPSRVVPVLCVSLAASACGGARHDDSFSPDAGTCTNAVARLVDNTGILAFQDAGTAFGVPANVDLAIAGSNVYYTIGRAAFLGPGGDVVPPRVNLVRLPLQGGPPVLVVSLSGNEQALLVVGSTAFLAISSSAGTEGQIVAVALDGASPSVLASATGTPARTLAVSGGTLIFADDEGTKSVALGGGGVTVLSQHTGAFTLIEGSLLVADGATQSIYRVPLGAGAETIVATGQFGVDLPFSCGPGVCWTTRTTPALGTGTAAAAIVELLPGLPPQSIATNTLLYSPWRVLFIAPDFYVTTLGDAMFGMLFRVKTDGSPPAVLSPGTGLAASGQCLYAAGGFSGIYSMSFDYASTYDGGSGSP